MDMDIDMDERFHTHSTVHGKPGVKSPSLIVTQCVACEDVRARGRCLHLNISNVMSRQQPS